jgi:D-alanine-D-alanine ligase-like ATP-grasp enzyme
MKICVLNVDNQNSTSAISKLEPLADPSEWLKEYSWDRFFICKKNAETQINKLLQKQYDVFLNLCDGAEGEDRPGIEVVEILENAKVAFTGAGSAFYDPSKEEMKTACIKAGINFPKGVTVFSSDYLSDNINGMLFPMIVKHPKSYNSIGMTKDSLVCNLTTLKIQVEKMISHFKSALIEEYIDGPEFTALVVENANDSDCPYVFTPMQMIFPEGETFKHFDLKWKDHASMSYAPCENKNMSEKIAVASSEMFKVMHGKGYARCDLRVNSKGDLFMLEINPNCSIYFPKHDCSSADQILFSEKNGHELFTKMILESAIKRMERIK